MPTILYITRLFSLTFPLLFSGLSLILILKLNIFPKLDHPIDHGLMINGKRLFGDNKTYRGVIVHVVATILASFILHIEYLQGNTSLIYPLFRNNAVLTGLIYSISYIAGELINSFIKRQLHILPGEIATTHTDIQRFFDLSDGIIAAAIALACLTSLTILDAVLAASIGIGFHYGTDILMTQLKMKHIH